MEEKENQSETFWSLDDYREYERTRSHFSDTRSKVINFLIALAFILSFIGFILFPQILIPGTLLLSACLIGAQALAGFAILATIAKVLFKIYETDWRETLRTIIFAPVDFFEKHPLPAALLTLGFLAIFVVIILSGTGVITVPFLTVFAANSLSLEIEEIALGLLSDIAVVSVGAMVCYLPFFVEERVNVAIAKHIDLSTVESEDISETSIQEFPNKQTEEITINNDDSLEDSSEDKSAEELSQEEEKRLANSFCNFI